ncbi:MAG: hypothetical protein AAGF26_09145, partial [Cyanobacteria bacterium P01_G01_bin.49]
ATFSVFRENYYKLMNDLENLKDSPKSLEMYNYDIPQSNERLIDEISRLFHNFLASAQSLVDHTTVSVSKLYSNHDFKDEYDIKKNKKLATNEVQKFIQKLRNYTQHYTLPLGGLEITFQQDIGIDLPMKLEVESLLKWKHWGDSKQYLERNIEGIFLEDLVQDYYQLIEDFYHWLDKRQHEIHKSDFEKLEIQERLEDYWLNKAMDEAQDSPILDRKAALEFLEE